jgi:microcystin-dependent protein
MSDVISDTKQSDRAFFGAIERYNSPLDTPTTFRCRRVRIPDDMAFVAALNELISRLGFPDFWRETTGGMTPDECAALGSALFEDYAESDGDCMTTIGEIKAVALATLPAHLLECDGATYNRVDYPDLYAALDAEFVVNADTFTVPDLRGITIIGAGLYNPGGITYAVNDLVGARRHTLDVTEIPSHTHVQDAHTHIQNSHNHTQNAHTHVQDAHTHVQNAHTHVQDAHTHVQNSHNHTQNAHTHTGDAHNHNLNDPGHTHGINHIHTIDARSNSAAGASAELMRSNGTGTAADLNSQVGSIIATGSATTGAIVENSVAGVQNATATNNAATAVNQNATATNQNATAVNQNATATNQSTTATNNAATAVNQSTTATNQNTGGGQPHNNMQPSRALKMVIVAR